MMDFSGATYTERQTVQLPPGGRADVRVHVIVDAPTAAVVVMHDDTNDTKVTSGGSVTVTDPIVPVRGQGRAGRAVSGLE
jgi:hypothetical protein